MKMIFLLPPSEQKLKWWDFDSEILNFNFDKPLDISINATEKDLKCTWNRYEEWMLLNKSISNGPFSTAIDRYTWVMFNSIWYSDFNEKQKDFFNNHFLIISWMYWLLKPLDIIWNYKLPIETKWLVNYWKDIITNTLNDLDDCIIIDLLPLSYKKVIDKNRLNKKIIEVDFIKKQDRKKISHWVKKIKGEFIKNIVLNNITNYNDFWWNIIDNWNWNKKIEILL